MIHSGNSVCGFYESQDLEDLTEEESSLVAIRDMVIKAKDRYYTVFNRAMDTNIYYAPLERDKDLALAEKFREVFERVHGYYENKMFEFYGFNWALMAPFEANVLL